LGNGEPFLSIEGLRVRYGRLEAVQGVSMDISRGAIACLLGANGSGKSTILKAISGLKRPAGGRIWFEGQRIEGLSAPRIVGLGIAQVPEGRRVFPHMTVLENLKMGAYSRKDATGIKKTLEEVFEYFPVLRERRSYAARTLSGGMQEMLAIARALMARPRVLLLDEPLQGLAPLVVDEIEGILLGLNARGVTLLIVEHNVRIALGLAHTVWILESGRVAHRGSPEEMSDTEYVQKVYLGG